MINKTILVGNVGNDPQVKYLDNGTCIAKFPLATSETWRTKDGEKKSETTWHNIVLWRKLAEVAEMWVYKGTQLYIEGKIRNSSYDNKEGVKVYRSEIIGDKMQLLGGKKKDEEPTATGLSSSDNGSNDVTVKDVSSTLTESNTGELSDTQPDDDLPF